MNAQANSPINKWAHAPEICERYAADLRKFGSPLDSALPDFLTGLAEYLRGKREPMTEPWETEGITIDHTAAGWVVKCGGAQMPRYMEFGEDVPEAVNKLVKAITRDAIADEAMKWMERLLSEEQHSQKLADAILDWKAAQGMARTGSILDDALDSHKARLNAELSDSRPENR